MVRKYPGLLLFVLLVFNTGLFGQPARLAWIVPEEAKVKVSPFQFTPETIKSGESVFQKNCKSCHGDPGKQNWAKIVPPPGDPASADFQKQTDGEMFFKVTNGKTPMPQFGNILPDEERWQVISYIRSFNADYVQPAPAIKTGSGSKLLSLRMYCNYRQKKLYVVCMEVTKDKQEIPAKGIEIQLNVKRYFGTLHTGETKSTNAAGLLTFDFPSDIPGGQFGILDLTLRLVDGSGLISSNLVRQQLAIGKPVQPKSLTDAHAMWSVRSKSPLWLVLAFSFSLITVWGFIFYILLSLRKLKLTN